MSSTGVDVAARRIFADALRLNWCGLDVRFALRCTIGIAVPLIGAAVAGQALLGAAAAYGALVTGFASRQGVYRTRIGAMFAAGAGLALSALAGSVTGPVAVAEHRAARAVGARVRPRRLRSAARRPSWP